MTLESAFTELVARCDGLEETCDNMLWAVVQGQPDASRGHALVDFYEDSSNDLVGRVKDSQAAAVAGKAAASGQLDLQATRQALRRCQECYQQVLLGFYDGVFAFERRSELRDLASRQTAWAAWARGVDDALTCCPQPLHAVGEALFVCWQDLVDRASLLIVSAQASLGTLQICVTDQSKGRHPPVEQDTKQPQATA